MHGVVLVVHLLEATDLMMVMLQEFDDIFKEPTRLPHPRCHNHRIHLLLDTAPVAVRPYHYPQIVKDEVEEQCIKMLLVKKHDGDGV